MGPPHSCSVIIVSPAVPTTPTTPRGASRRGRREAVAAWPAAAVAVVASRAKPPERRREESDNYSEIFRIKIIDLVINCHTASPATTGKLTEIK